MKGAFRQACVIAGLAALISVFPGDVCMAQGQPASQAIPALPDADLQAPSEELRLLLQRLRLQDDAPAAARESLRRLAESGAADTDAANALLALGHCWEHGIGGDRSPENAVANYREAAERGATAAMRRLGQLLLAGGEGVPADPAAAAAWLQKAVNGGDAASMLALGLLYQDGRGVPADLDRSLFLCRQAAESGWPEAMLHLGISAMQGSGAQGKPDDALALDWFSKAAAAGSVPGMFNLGRFHDDGRGGLAVDKTEAFSWFRKAADAGYAVAQNEVAARYRDGRGTGRDVAEAVRWFNTAAAQGLPAAMVNLGVLHENGADGIVEKDEAKAAALYVEAAKRHDPVGQFLLSRLYESGKGVPQDPVAAYVLADESSRRGYRPAEKRSEMLRQRLSAGQLQEAESRLRLIRGDGK